MTPTSSRHTGWTLNKHFTFRQGLDETSKEALKVRLCWVVKIVRGLLGRLLSRSSDLIFLPVTPSDSSSSSSSSSSLLPSGKTRPIITHTMPCENSLLWSVKPLSLTISDLCFSLWFPTFPTMPNFLQLCANVYSVHMSSPSPQVKS